MSSQQNAPPCRSQFVLQWLEDHAKYFTHPVCKPDLPPLVTQIGNRTFPSQAQSYQCSEAVQIRSKVVNTLYIQPPYKISPVQQWLDDHAKHFEHPAPKPELPPLVTRIANRSYPSQAQSYQCSEAVQIRSKVNNTLYIQPPYKISPVKPFLRVRNNQS